MTISRDLADTVRGDLEAFSRLREQSHEAILRARGEVPALVVTRDAVRTVLEALRRRRITPEQAQQWAFFVRHGFVGRWVTPDPSFAYAEAVPSAHREGIAELEIDYEAAAEQEIADAVVRLDELGDSVDGEITDREIVTMLRSLAETTDNGEPTFSEGKFPLNGGRRERPLRL